jgi:predicted phage baseplate assembly protein
VRAYWLRARLLGESVDRPVYRASPKLRTVTVAALGGTVEAEHSERVPREVVGRSNGRPDQRFVVSRPPVLARMDGETVEVVAADGRVTVWTEVEDFIDTGPDDRHFMWSSTSGEIRFGPVVRNAQGELRSYGAIPLEGSQIVVTEYRTGGGAAGNVGAKTITNLRSTVPYVAAVENFRAATGGVDAETVDNAKIRGPYLLRAGARAVTVPDFERLSREADPAIARVRCLPPTEDGKPIRILLVPDVDTPAELLQLDDFALPDGMIARVVEHLEERRMLGSVIEVGTPYYQGVTIAALVAAGPGRPQRLVKERATEALYRFVHPLRGGPDGYGWPFDTDLNSATIYQLLEGVDGVERVDEVLFFEYDLRNNERSGFGRDVVKLGSNALFLSANHQVVVSA